MKSSDVAELQCSGEIQQTTGKGSLQEGMECVAETWEVLFYRGREQPLACIVFV